MGRRTKGKRILKNGAIGAYVYYAKEKNWKWRIIGRNTSKGGTMTIADLKVLGINASLEIMLDNIN